MAYGHSQSLESQLIQAPGLVLVEPSTPHDAKGLLKSAIRSDDPVIFFEHKKLLLGGVQGEVPDGEYTIPFGEAVTRKQGKDATVVAFGFMVYEALNAAQAVGDDRIQMESQGMVVPDSFTHGTSQQRMRWFKNGFTTGDLSQGDTFNTDNL